MPPRIVLRGSEGSALEGAGVVVGSLLVDVGSFELVGALESAVELGSDLLVGSADEVGFFVLESWVLLESGVDEGASVVLSLVEASVVVDVSLVEVGSAVVVSLVEVGSSFVEVSLVLVGSALVLVGSALVLVGSSLVLVG